MERQVIYLLLLLSALVQSSAEAGAVYQPRFVCSTHQICQSGTGSLVRGPSGHIYALTCAHVVPSGGCSLRAVEWRGIGPETSTIRLHAQPHCYAVHEDFALFQTKHPTAIADTFELQPGPHYQEGAAVWLPNRSPQSPQGYDRILGWITGQTPHYVIVTLDQTIDLQARSGTPVLLEQSGKMIGILSRGGIDNGRTTLYLIPAHIIYPCVK